MRNRVLPDRRATRLEKADLLFRMAIVVKL
jgi:hypothetical protein